MFDIDQDEVEVFDYNYGSLCGWLAMLVPAVVFIYYFYSKGVKEGFWFCVFCLVFACYHLLLTLYIICRVSIEDNMITISYLFPFRKEHEYTFSDIKEYTNVKIMSAKKPLFGYLQPKDDETIRLWYSGTKRFEELDEILLDLFPPTETEE